MDFEKQKYFEEKVINGVLSYRYAPYNEWVAYSAEDLTKKILELQKELSILFY